MKVGIFANYNKPHSKEIEKTAEKILKSQNIELLYEESDIYKNSDIIVTVGGDGTIIHHAKKAAIYNKPILSINAGRIGFLAGLEKEEIDLLKNLINKNYKTEKRMLLNVSVNNKTYYCLNDAVISKGAISRMIDLNVCIDGGPLHFRSDGLIAATPTGSTAYSLSAGGPIIDPTVENILITPICAQSVGARSLVLNPDSLIKINVDKKNNTDAFLTIDGEVAIPVDGDIIIKKEKEIYVKLIKINDKSFYKILSEKLKVGE